jgi:hypothetical protein
VHERGLAKEARPHGTIPNYLGLVGIAGLAPTAVRDGDGVV